ncbi:hypothetical protein GGR56DRAFT_628361 [Xylariaceae sp. FL0804]|nr:hypothetical protein GGR56DRAFT_628361 [Xylariaceae sp. FL0804]
MAEVAVHPGRRGCILPAGCITHRPLQRRRVAFPTTRLPLLLSLSLSLTLRLCLCVSGLSLSRAVPPHKSSRAKRPRCFSGASQSAPALPQLMIPDNEYDTIAGGWLLAGYVLGRLMGGKSDGLGAVFHPASRYNYASNGNERAVEAGGHKAPTD